MSRIIVCFDNEVSRTRIREMLESAGFSVSASFRSGAEVKRQVKSLGSAIVICGARLSDMTADELAYDLTKPCLLLVIAKPVLLDNCENRDIFKLPSPVCRGDLIATVRILMQLEEKYRRIERPHRSLEEESLIKMAKETLMRKRCISEAEAYRFIQRQSMNTGTKMADTAREILEAF